MVALCLYAILYPGSLRSDFLRLVYLAHAYIDHKVFPKDLATQRKYRP